MRDLEFRATRKDTRETFEVLNLDWINRSVFLAGHMIEVDMDSVIIQQFTGLLDKNGVKIFEGDIVTGGVTNAEPVSIQWSHVSRWSGMADGYMKHGIGFNFDEYSFILGKCEVIGNIHEEKQK